MRQMLLKASSCHLGTLLQTQIADTIVVVCVEVLAVEHLKVDEEEFKATQAKVEAARMPAPLHNAPFDDNNLKGALHASIDLYGKGNLEENNMEQEDVRAIYEFSTRMGGKPKGFGPQSSLAHYLGQLSPGYVIILHNEFTPQSHFMTWLLKALSKEKQKVEEEILKVQTNEAFVKDKRNNEEEILEISKGQSRASIRTNGEQMPKATPLPKDQIKDASKDKKQSKVCGPSFKLSCDIELATALKVFKELIDNKVKVTWRDILGWNKEGFWNQKKFKKRRFSQDFLGVRMS
ncbi:hypothetical protein L7F22_035870 [Adiantum nelumboides]|nr:hypothetical protein [Adiantum nelumboides]